MSSARAHLLRARTRCIRFRPIPLNSFSISLPRSRLVVKAMRGVTFLLVNDKMKLWNAKQEPNLAGIQPNFGRHLLHANGPKQLSPLARHIVCCSDFFDLFFRRTTTPNKIHIRIPVSLMSFTSTTITPCYSPFPLLQISNTLRTPERVAGTDTSPHAGRTKALAIARIGLR